MSALSQNECASQELDHFSFMWSRQYFIGCT